MMEITVVPLSQIGKIKIGMCRDEVRRILGEAREFKKSKFSRNTTDDFGWCHVFYDNDNKCEAVEIFDAKVFVGKICVFPAKKSEIISVFSDLTSDDYGYTSVKYSVGIAAPDGNPESILFGAKGYYKK